jgi:hypothetical protein
MIRREKNNTTEARRIMNLFGWRSKGIRVESMAAGCKLGGLYIQSSICEVSRNGMTCTIPSSRVQGSLMEMLHTEISVSIDNMLLDGILSWYTIEESSYLIGITIDRKQRSSWRRIFAERCREVVHTSTRHASI